MAMPRPMARIGACRAGKPLRLAASTRPVISGISSTPTISGLTNHLRQLISYPGLFTEPGNDVVRYGLRSPHRCGLPAGVPGPMAHSSLRVRGRRREVAPQPPDVGIAARPRSGSRGGNVVGAGGPRDPLGLRSERAVVYGRVASAGCGESSTLAAPCAGRARATTADARIVGTRLLSGGTSHERLRSSLGMVVADHPRPRPSPLRGRVRG